MRFGINGVAGVNRDAGALASVLELISEPIGPGASVAKMFWQVEATSNLARCMAGLLGICASADAQADVHVHQNLDTPCKNLKTQACPVSCVYALREGNIESSGHIS